MDRPTPAIALPESAESPGSPTRHVKPRNPFAARLFGYDIFLSFALGPPPRGTRSYASDLARRLRERDFTVFFSEEEAPPGETLDSTLRAALLRSKILVVIANRATLQEPRWVRREIEEFRRHRSHRPVIAINVDGALEDPQLATTVQPWLGYQGKIWLDESAEAVAMGITSDTLVDRLATAPTRAKSSAKWRWVVRGVIASLGVLTAAAIAFALLASRNAEEATRQRNTAIQQRTIAEERLQVALARDLAAQATIIQGQAGRLLPRSILLAIESLRRSPSLQATLALTAGLRVLPATNRSFAHPTGSNAIAFSPDGSMIASGGEEGTARVWRIADGKEVLHVRHGRRVSNVAFSVDGEYLASAGGFDGTAKVWELAGGTEVLSIAQKGQLDVLAFSADGKLLLSASGYNLTDHFGGQPGNTGVYVWSIAERKQVARLDHPGSVTAVRFFPGGTRLATAGQDGTVRLWTDPSGREELQIPCETTVLGMDISPDGTRIATSTSKHVAIWDAKSGVVIWKSERQPFDVGVVMFSRDGKRVASGGYDDTARVWDVATGRELAQFKHDAAVFDLAFSKDGSHLATVGADATARVFDLSRDVEIQRTVYKMPVFNVRLAVNDQYMATASQDGTVKVWEPPWKSAPRELKLDGPVSMLVFSPSGRYIATASGDAYADNTARLWAIDTRRELARIVHRSGVHQVAFSPDERYLATASEDHSARVLDIASGKVVRQFQHGDDVQAVAFGPDSQTLATASFDGTARIFDVDTGRELSRVQHEQTVWSVAYSSDGRWVASGDASGTVKVWKPHSGDIHATFSVGSSFNQVVFSPDGKELAGIGENAVIWDLDGNAERARVTVAGKNTYGQFLSGAFAADGRIFATAGLDGHARCWRVSDSKMVADFRHEASVLSVAFSADGRYLATGSEDKFARIWEIATGREVLRQEYKDWAASVAFSPDGRVFAVGSRDHSVRLEPWHVSDLIEQACARLGMNLTPDEWREYLPNETYRPTCP